MGWFRLGVINFPYAARLECFDQFQSRLLYVSFGRRYSSLYYSWLSCPFLIFSCERHLVLLGTLDCYFVVRIACQVSTWNAPLNQNIYIPTLPTPCAATSVDRLLGTKSIATKAVLFLSLTSALTLTLTWPA